MAAEFPLDNIDYRGVLSRTYRPSRRLSHPLPSTQLSYPVHPGDQNNWTPSVGERIDLPFDLPPDGTQAVNIQYPPLSITSSDPNVEMDGTTEGVRPPSHSQDEASGNTVDPNEVLATRTLATHTQGETEGATTVPMVDPASNMEIDTLSTTEGPALIQDTKMGESTALPFADDSTLGGTIPGGEH